MLVFDLNGTLIKRFFKHRYRMDVYDYETENYYVMIRPHIRELAKYLNDSGISYAFWTNALQHNAKDIVDILKNEGMQPCLLLNQDHCSYKSGVCKKDLKIVSVKCNVALSSIYLVEDNPSRSVEGQNLIHVETFNGDKRDEHLLQLIVSIKKIFDKK